MACRPSGQQTRALDEYRGTHLSPGKGRFGSRKRISSVSSPGNLTVSTSKYGPLTNIRGFISHPMAIAASACNKSGYRHRAPESCVRRPEFGGCLLAGATIGILCTARITWPVADRSRISGGLSPTFHQQHRRATNQAINIGHRNPVYTDRNLVGACWPKQSPGFDVQPDLPCL